MIRLVLVPAALLVTFCVHALYISAGAEVRKQTFIFVKADENPWSCLP